MNVTKSQMTVDGDLIRLSMPFAKVDKKRRLVSGFATLDNIDSEGDVVEASASAKAFARARGNIREMHDKIAVGRMVDFREDEYFDKESGETYRGMYVTARVSEGAPNTWTKVLDGTLSGFSIGGEIIEFDNKITKDASGKSQKIRLIKDYDLQELSLVDNPANPLANFDAIQKANVVSFQKSASGSVEVTGMVADTELENVFICPNDETVLIKKESDLTCTDCGSAMEMAGWFENGPDRKDKIRHIVNKFLKSDSQEALPSTEGGVEMAKSEKPVAEGKETNLVNPSEEHEDGTKVDEAAEEGQPAAIDVDETEDTEEVEKAELTAESPDEVEDDEATQISKTITEMRDSIIQTLEKSKDETSQRVSDVEAKIEKATSEFLAEQAKIREEMSALGESLKVTKSRISELESNLEKMNKGAAIRKSAELEDDEAVETVQKSTFWNGAFSGNRKGFSIDNLM